MRDQYSAVRRSDAVGRFWKYVQPEESGCWRWVGYLSGKYGRMTWNHRMTLAHRVSWEIHFGRPDDAVLVLHQCPGGGNSWCVNPDHLTLGTHRDNAADMVAAGRHWSQTGAWTPKRRARPNGVKGEMRDIVVTLQRTVYRRLAAQAESEGVSLQEYAARALAAL